MHCRSDSIADAYTNSAANNHTDGVPNRNTNVTNSRSDSNAHDSTNYPESNSLANRNANR
jgi:hypothetical protein